MFAFFPKGILKYIQNLTHNRSSVQSLHTDTCRADILEDDPRDAEMFVRYRVVVDVELSVGTAFGQQFRQEWFVNVVVQIGDGDFYCRRFTDVVLVDFKSANRKMR